MAPPPLSSAPPLCGFDELAKRVEACVQIANPKLTERTNNTATAGAAPSAPSSSIAAAAQTAKSNVARMMNSNFSDSHGKSKRKSTPSSDTTTGSRRASKRPKRSTTSTVCDPSSAISNTPVPQFNALYAIDAESLAPPHRSIEHSTQSLHYNRLLPSQIVRLSKNDELIIVISSYANDADPRVKAGIDDINQQINSIILATCTGYTSAERKEQLQQSRKKHQITRDGATAYQFAVRIKNYGERHRLEELTLTGSDLNDLWKDTGINVELCGYASSARALFRFRYIGYIELHMLAKLGGIVRKELQFTRSGDTEAPLIDQLWLVKGCVVSTMEVMMNYYKEIARRRNNELTIVKRRAKTAKAKQDQEVAASITVQDSLQQKEDEAAFFGIMKDELSKEKLYQFASEVDTQYYERFGKQYRTFTRVSDVLLPDDNLSVASSVAGSVGGRVVSGLDAADVEDETAGADDMAEEPIESVSSALKKLGNVKKRKFNKKALKDPFVEGKKSLKNVKKGRG